MKTKFLIGTFLSTVGMFSPLAAQTASADATAAAAPGQAMTEPNRAADIVVTAQKRTERLQEVPLSVSVVSGNTLATASRPGIESVAALVPALNVQKSGTTLNQTIFLRGVGTATFSIAGEPSVSTVVDGVVFSRSGEAFSDLIDVDQLEVLRGPQGTLFGKNASAGVINIITKAPTATAGGSVEASYFSGNEVRGKAVANLPLGENLLSRWTGFFGSYDGNIDNVTTGNKVNGYRHYGGRGQIVYKPAGVRLALTADYHHNNDDCCAEVIGTGPLTGAGANTTSAAFNVLPTPQGDDTRDIAQNLVTRTKETGWGISAQADVDVGEHVLTSISAYRRWNNTEVRDGDFLPAAYVGFNQLHDKGPQESHTLSQEIRLASPASAPLSYVVGGYYSLAISERVFTRQDEVCTARAGAPTGVLIPCGSANANPSTFPNGTADFGSTLENLAAFGQATGHLSERARIVAGLRYTIDKLAVFHSRKSPLTGPGIQPNFDQGVYDRYQQLIAAGSSGTAAASAAAAASNGVPWRSRTKNNNLSGKAAFQYDFSSDVMGYASYTRGYKGPAYNVFFNLTGTGTNPIDPETSNSYEVGLKNTLLGGRLVLNVDAFLAKYKNFQANNPDVVAGVVVTRFTNAGRVSTRGAEADFLYRDGGLTISGGGAYTDAKVDQFKVAPGAAPTAIIPSGTTLAFSPKWKGSLSVDQRVDAGDFGIYLGAGVTAQTKQLALFSPDPVQRAIATIHGYALVNASVGIGDNADRYRVTLQVRNLFDQSFAAAIQNGGPTGSYRYQIPRDADRYFGITGRANF